MILGLIGEFFVACVVGFVVLWALDNFWIGDDSFDGGGSEKLWVSIIIAIIAFFATFFVI